MTDLITDEIVEAALTVYHGRSPNGWRKVSMTRMRAALTAALPMLMRAEWQPIETAPKDVEWSSSLPFCAYSGVAVAYAEDDGPNEGEALFLVLWEQAGPGFSETTHWMPLPAPPATAIRSRGEP